MENSHDLFLAFGLTLIAGLATGIGSLIAFLAKHTDSRFLSASLGLSAGVMIYVSFMELMPESVSLLSELYTERTSYIYMLLSFFSGIAIIALIDRLVPEDENPHEMHLVSERSKGNRLKRTGIMMAFAIGIHNFPEGIAVSVPIYHATGSKKKAFIYSFLSGMAEPVGALLGYLFLASIWTDSLNALILAFISGIMVYISFDELLPGTEKYGHHHCGVAGVVLGMAVMAVSLLVL